MQQDIARQLQEVLGADEAEAVVDAIGAELASTDNRVIHYFVGTLVVAALALYRAERRADGPIRTFGDALWSSFNAVTAVGESGCPPVTPWGRLINAGLILVGTPLYTQVSHRVAAVVERLGVVPAPVPTAGQVGAAAAVAVVPAGPSAANESSSIADSAHLAHLDQSLAHTTGMVTKVEAATVANRRTLMAMAQQQVDMASTLERMQQVLAAFQQALRIPPADAPVATVAARAAVPPAGAPVAAVAARAAVPPASAPVAAVAARAAVPPAGARAAASTQVAAPPAGVAHSTPSTDSHDKVRLAMDKMRARPTTAEQPRTPAAPLPPPPPPPPSSVSQDEVAEAIERAKQKYNMKQKQKQKRKKR